MQLPLYTTFFHTCNSILRPVTKPLCVKLVELVFKEAAIQEFRFYSSETLLKINQLIFVYDYKSLGL